MLSSRNEIRYASFATGWSVEVDTVLCLTIAHPWIEPSNVWGQRLNEWPCHRHSRFHYWSEEHDGFVHCLLYRIFQTAIIIDMISKSLVLTSGGAISSAAIFSMLQSCCKRRWNWCVLSYSPIKTYTRFRKFPQDLFLIVNTEIPRHTRDLNTRQRADG